MVEAKAQCRGSEARAFVDGNMLTSDFEGVMDAIGVTDAVLRRQVTECLMHKDTLGWD